MNFVKFARTRQRVSSMGVEDTIKSEKVVLILSDSKVEKNYDPCADINVSASYRLLAIEDGLLQVSVPLGGYNLFVKHPRAYKNNLSIYDTSPSKDECVILVNEIKTVLDNAINSIRDEKEIIKEAVTTIRNRDLSDAEAADKLSELIKKLK